jgi:biotin-dependent carboxylase-like uncharacterized protein
MLKIIDAGISTTIQDAGRWGYQTYGVPVSGAMDYFSFALANRLVHNAANTAALEIHSPVSFQAQVKCVLALTGTDADLRIDGRKMPAWASVLVRAGSHIEIAPHRLGWNYLAVHGGIDAPKILGSHSTYVRASLGQTLQAGDEIAIGVARDDLNAIAGELATERVRGFANRTAPIRIVLGPQNDWFASSAIESLTTSAYTLTEMADRMGYRLSGAELPRARNDELISCGIPLGAIQVPANQQPIVLMADHQTTGGYPIIAVVIRADLPVLAQKSPGEPIHFEIIEIDAAQQAWHALLALLK